MTEYIRPTFSDLLKISEAGFAREITLSRKARYVGGYLIIHVPLPFRIALYDGFRYGWDDDEARFLELIHYPKPLDLQFGEPIFQTDALERLSPPSQYHYTVARFGMPVRLEYYEGQQTFKAHPEAADIAARFLGEDKPEVDVELGRLMDEGINALNFLIRSCRITVKDFLERPLDSLNSLPFTVMYSVWDISQTIDLAFTVGCLKREDIEMVGKGMLLLHEVVPFRIEPPDFETTGKIVRLASPALRNNPHPFFSASDLLRNSVSREREGNNTGAIIDSVTGIEMFVSTIIRLDKNDKGLSEEEISNILKAGFKNLLKDHLARPLKVSFNPHYPENALELWFTYAYGIRNEVVHEGKQATRHEARRVCAQSDSLAVFIKDTMDKNPQRWTHVRPLL